MIGLEAAEREAFGVALDDYLEGTGTELDSVVWSLHVAAEQSASVDVATLIGTLIDAAGIAPTGATGLVECMEVLWSWEACDGATVVAGVLARLAGRDGWWTENVGG